MLAHDPRRLREAATLDVQLVLAGHTHGGQVVLPGIGAVAARRFPVIAGESTEGNCTLFVSRGVGTVFVPLRINCPPEVSVLVLRARRRELGAPTRPPAPLRRHAGRRWLGRAVTVGGRRRGHGRRCPSSPLARRRRVDRAAAAIAAERRRCVVAGSIGLGAWERRCRWSPAGRWWPPQLAAGAGSFAGAGALLAWTRGRSRPSGRDPLPTGHRRARPARRHAVAAGHRGDGVARQHRRGGRALRVDR